MKMLNIDKLKLPFKGRYFMQAMLCMILIYFVEVMNAGK